MDNVSRFILFFLLPILTLQALNQTLHLLQIQNSTFFSIAVADDDSYIVATTLHEIKVISLDGSSSTLHQTIAIDSSLKCIDISRYHEFIVVGTEEGELLIYKWDGNEFISHQNLTQDSSPINSVDILDNYNSITIGKQNGRIIFNKFEDGFFIKTKRQINVGENIYSLRFCDSLKIILVGCESKVLIYERLQKQIILRQTLASNFTGGSDVDISGDCMYISIAYQQGVFTYQNNNSLYNIQSQINSSQNSVTTLSNYGEILTYSHGSESSLLENSNGFTEIQVYQWENLTVYDADMSNSLCFSFNDGFIAIVEFTGINKTLPQIPVINTNNDDENDDQQDQKLCEDTCDPEDDDDKKDEGFESYLIGIIVGVVVIIGIVVGALCFHKYKKMKGQEMQENDERQIEDNSYNINGMKIYPDTMNSY